MEVKFEKAFLKAAKKYAGIYCIGNKGFRVFQIADKSSVNPCQSDSLLTNL